MHQANKPSEITETYNTETTAVISFPVYPVSGVSGTCSGCLLDMNIITVCSKGATVTKLESAALFSSQKYCSAGNS